MKRPNTVNLSVSPPTETTNLSPLSRPLFQLFPRNHTRQHEDLQSPLPFSSSSTAPSEPLDEGSRTPPASRRVSLARLPVPSPSLQVIGSSDQRHKYSSLVDEVGPPSCHQLSLGERVKPIGSVPVLSSVQAQLLELFLACVYVLRSLIGSDTSSP
jgi:hypothetical protein